MTRTLDQAVEVKLFMEEHCPEWKPIIEYSGRGVRVTLSFGLAVEIPDGSSDPTFFCSHQVLKRIYEHIGKMQTIADNIRREING